MIFSSFFFLFAVNTCTEFASSHQLPCHWLLCCLGHTNITGFRSVNQRHIKNKKWECLYEEKSEEEKVYYTYTYIKKWDSNLTERKVDTKQRGGLEWWWWDFVQCRNLWQVAVKGKVRSGVTAVGNRSKSKLERNWYLINLTEEIAWKRSQRP